jgi:hypothetical protein
MGQKQRDAIAEAVDEVMTDDDDDSGLCFTPYVHSDEPLARLQACGATKGLDADLELLDWGAGVFATVGIDELDDADVAQLIDQVFVRLLGCDDASYQISASTEDLG